MQDPKAKICVGSHLLAHSTQEELQDVCHSLDHPYIDQHNVGLSLAS